MNTKSFISALLSVHFIFAFSPVIAQAEEASSKSKSREEIKLTRTEREFLLSEMRDFLEAVARIVAANNSGNMQELANAAQGVGLKAHKAALSNPDSIVHIIRKKTPPSFFPLGKATHEGFDEIAHIANTTADSKQINTLLAQNLQRCVACHANYRISETP